MISEFIDRDRDDRERERGFPMKNLSINSEKLVLVGLVNDCDKKKN